MNASNGDPSEISRTKRHEIEKLLDSIGWGLFFILLGVIWLFPDEVVPEGVFLMGLGAIFIGLNIARYIQGLKISTFWTAVGAILLALGISEFYGLNIPVIPAVIILSGVSMIVKSLFRKK